jgi:hypothetical protein
VEHGRRRRVSWGGCGLTREPRHGRLVPAGRARDKAFSIYSPLPIRATTLICCDFGQKQTLVFFILGNPIVTGTRVERVQSEFGTTRGIICSISVHSFFCMHDKKKYNTTLDCQTQWDSLWQVVAMLIIAKFVKAASKKRGHPVTKMVSARLII